MRTLLLSFCLIAGLVPASALAAPVPADHRCMGPWVGEGQNTGHASPWTIELTMTATPQGGRCGTIEYGNPDCGGTLEECSLVGDEIHTQEDYTHLGSCAPPGRVVIRCDGDTMRYSWHGWEVVNSTLRRPPGWTAPTPSNTQPEPPPTDGPPTQPPNGPPTQPPNGPDMSPAVVDMPSPALPPPPPLPEESGFFGCASAPPHAHFAYLFMLGALLLRSRARRT